MQTVCVQAFSNADSINGTSWPPLLTGVEQAASPASRRLTAAIAAIYPAVQLLPVTKQV